MPQLSGIHRIPPTFDIAQRQNYGRQACCLYRHGDADERGAAGAVHGLLPLPGLLRARAQRGAAVQVHRAAHVPRDRLPEQVGAPTPCLPACRACTRLGVAVLTLLIIVSCHHACMHACGHAVCPQLPVVTLGLFKHRCPPCTDEAMLLPAGRAGRWSRRRAPSSTGSAPRCRRTPTRRARCPCCTRPVHPTFYLLATCPSL